MVPRQLVLATILALLLAGCLGVPPSQSTASDRPSSTPRPVGTTGTVGTTPIPTDGPTQAAPDYGTQFVSVRRFENRSVGATWPADERTTFENLADAQRAVFRRALESGRQRFGPDETNPFDYSDHDRPRVVRYRGEWYLVRVANV